MDYTEAVGELGTTEVEKTPTKKQELGTTSITPLAAENEKIIRQFHQELSITGYSERTLKMYETYTRLLLAHASKKAQDVERSDIVDFMAHMKEKRNASN